MNAAVDVTLAIVFFPSLDACCEIEDFVETHVCMLCVILRSRVLRVDLSSLRM